MKHTFLWLLSLLPFFTKAQNLPQCDSLVITCCSFDSLAPNSITIYVSNPSTELFDYPGFVLLDADMDTIAKETVNYFGIGTWPQPHTMTIVSPLTLPFTGFLELHTLFYLSFACSFPFFIPDTATIVEEIKQDASIVVFPNPCAGELHIALPGNTSNGELLLSIMDAAGKEVYGPGKKQLPATLFLNGIQPGLYFLRIANSKNQLMQFHKVVVVE